MRRQAKRERTAEEAIDPRAIKRAALGLLARRDHSAGELERKLREQGFAGESIAPVLADLSTKRFVDDERYLEHFIAYRMARGQGPARIRAELRPLGLPQDSIERHLDAVTDWPAQARKVRDKKFGAELPRDYRARAKQARFLEYRGFSAEQIRAALEREVESD